MRARQIAKYPHSKVESASIKTQKELLQGTLEAQTRSTGLLKRLRYWKIQPV